MSHTSFYQICRRETRHFLNNPLGFWGNIFSGLIALLILLSVAIIPLEILPIFADYHSELFIFELIVVTFFVIEYLLRLWSTKQPWRYALSWFGLIDLVAIAPFFLENLGLLEALGFPPQYLFAIRLLRLVRLLKLGNIYESQRVAMKTVCDTYKTDFVAIDNERIVYVIHKHPIVLFFHITPPILMLSLAMGILILFHANLIGLLIGLSALSTALFIFLKVWLDYHYDVIYITNCRLVVQDQHIFGSTISDIIYEAIADIRPETAGIWRWLFRYGDILIETSADANRGFTHAANPRKAVHMIALYRQRAINGTVDDERDTEERSNSASGVLTGQVANPLRKRAPGGIQRHLLPPEEAVVSTQPLPKLTPPKQKSDFDFLRNRVKKLDTFKHPKKNDQS